MRYLFSLLFFVSSHLSHRYNYDSENQKRQKLYEDWCKLRDIAKKKAGGKLPDDFDKYPIPPPPLPVEDIDIEHLSMDLSAVSLDAELGQELDDSGIERVPMADPGLDVCYFARNLRAN